MVETSDYHTDYNIKVTKPNVLLNLNKNQARDKLFQDYIR